MNQLPPQTKVCYEFAGFLLDPTEHLLLKEDLQVDLRGKPLDLLTYLVRNNHQLVSRVALLDEIWGDTSVGDHSLTVAINSIRKVLDPQDKESFIQTVPSKGYRFVQEVRQIETASSRTQVQIVEKGHALAVPQRRTVSARYKVALPVIIFGTILISIGAGWRYFESAKIKSRNLYEKALDLEHAGDDTLASATLEEVVRIDPSNHAASLHAAWLLYQDDQSERAHQTLAKLLEEKSLSEVTRLEAQGLNALVAEDFEIAQRDLELAIANGDNDVIVFEWLTEIGFQRETLDEAKSYLSHCLKLKPADSICNYDELELLIRRNDFEGALRAYPQASNATNGYPWLHQLAGFAFLGLNRPQEAKAQFDQLSRFGRDSAGDVQFRAATEGFAQVALLNQDYGNAEDYIENALANSSSVAGRTEYLLYLAGIEALSGERTKAIESVNAAAITLSTDEQRSNASRVLILAGDLPLARQILERPQPIGQRLIASREVLAGIEELHDKSHYQEAISHIAKARSLDSDPMINWILAEAELSHQDCKTASATFKDLQEHRGSILTDSFAAFIPLSEKGLESCAARRQDSR